MDGEREKFEAAFEAVKESIRYFKSKPNADSAYNGRIIGMEDALAEFRPVMKMIEQARASLPSAQPSDARRDYSDAWKREKPSIEAQKIRSAVAHEIDTLDDIPDYVWDIVDIAAERALKAALTTQQAQSSASLPVQGDVHTVIDERIKTYRNKLANENPPEDDQYAMRFAIEALEGVKVNLRATPTHPRMTKEELVDLIATRMTETAILECNASAKFIANPRGTAAAIYHDLIAKLPHIVAPFTETKE